MNLETLLHQTFGHSTFRANQEAVCRAATDGRDVLLVMPTGAGKSLCYQLPAIARGPHTHSGLDREQSRQACREYLDGSLQFLFIAPERMRVLGFPEILARKKPALIAFHEAHAISPWDHDFPP